MAGCGQTSRKDTEPPAYIGCRRSGAGFPSATSRMVEKTARVLVLHEDVLTAGFGGDIAAVIAEHHFESLDAPVRRIGATDTPVGYAPDLEDAILPQVDGITEALRELAKY